MKRLLIALCVLFLFVACDPKTEIETRVEDAKTAVEEEANKQIENLKEGIKEDLKERIDEL